MTNPFALTGKVAVVTGSSRGIGRSIAETMARLGARVVVSSRTEAACRPVVDAIAAEGGEAVAIPCNIARKPEVEALVAGTLARFGRIDILVCNAAVNPVYGPMSELADEAFDKIMSSNVKSNLWLCNLLIPGMAERGGGRVTGWIVRGRSGAPWRPPSRRALRALLTMRECSGHAVQA